MENRAAQLHRGIVGLGGLSLTACWPKVPLLIPGGALIAVIALRVWRRWGRFHKSSSASLSFIEA